MSRPLPVHRTAIVVGLQDYREADRIVRLLTPENGRITAHARNARKPSRRFGGALDIGNRIDATLRPPRGGWWGMDAALLQDGRTHARGDLERIALMAYATEVCGQLSREEHPEPKLYGLLDMAITLIDALIEPASQLFRLGLEAKALTFAGIAPRFTTCMTCDLEAEGKMLLTTSGVHHYACSRDGEQVSTQWLLAVEGARRSPLRESIDAPDPSGPQWILAELLEQHLGRRLRSRSILATLTL